MKLKTTNGGTFFVHTHQVSLTPSFRITVLGELKSLMLPALVFLGLTVMFLILFMKLFSAMT
jgi:hypothetical protein